MALDTQLRRTIGTVYGEIMRDSGINLPNGRYISTDTFFHDMVGNGVGSNPVRRRIVRNLTDADGYGARDNIQTGIQLLVKEPYVSSTYTFNPWRELFGREFLGDSYSFLPNRTYETVRTNPREAVRIERDLYALFTVLPQSMQEEFLGMLESYPCILMTAMDGVRNHEVRNITTITPQLKDIVTRIKRATPSERQEDIDYVLNVLAIHNICVRKGELISRQIRNLVDYNIETIPTSWQEGHLDDEVIAEKRAELNALFAKRQRTA